MKEKSNRSAQDVADRQLHKNDKRAKKLLAAAKRGGTKGAGLAEAAAVLMSEVAGHRVEQARAEGIRRTWESFVTEVASLAMALTSAKVPAATVPDAGCPVGLGSGAIRAPRAMQVYGEIRKLSELRRTAEPALQAEIERQINALVDEYLTLKRAEVEPALRNYRMMVARTAAERLAALLVDLELAEQPNKDLEEQRDRLGSLLARCAELNAMDDLRAATGAEETP